MFGFFFFFFAWKNYFFLFVMECLGWPHYFLDVPTYHAYSCFFANTTAASRVRRIRWAPWGLYTFGQEWLQVTQIVKSESVRHSVMSNFLWPHDCSPLGSSVYWISQARILEWVAIPFSCISSRSRDWTWVSRIAGRFFTAWATREAAKAFEDTHSLNISQVIPSFLLYHATETFMWTM